MVQEVPTRDVFSRHQPFPNERVYTDDMARSTHFQHDRLPADTLARYQSVNQQRNSFDAGDNGQAQEVHDRYRRQQLIPIDEAMRTRCGINGRHYFVAVTMEDGGIEIFNSPNQLHDNVSSQFFDSAKFQEVMERISTGANPILDNPQPSGGRRLRESRRSSIGSQRSSRLSSRRGSHSEDSSRHNGVVRSRPNREDTSTTVGPSARVSSRPQLRIGDEEAIWDFYEQRLKDCQQNACKLMAKAWIKIIEPKKQSSHPYTKGEETAPDWWPKPYFDRNGTKRAVRHKEPDHLRKGERLHLLQHIMRLVIQPRDRQMKQIREAGLTVKRLQEVAFDSLAGWFDQSEANGRKRQYLGELISVAKKEERYKRGNIDATTNVFVQSSDGIPERLEPDEDDDDDTEVKVEDEPDTPRSNVVYTPQSDQSPAGHNIPAGSFIGDVQMRSQYLSSMMPEMPQSHHGFVENSGAGVHSPTTTNTGGDSMQLDTVPGAHDHSRRASIYNGFTNPGTHPIYPPQWQPAAANQPPMYNYTTAQPATQPASFVSPSVPMGQSQAFMGGNFQGGARPGYDPGANAMFRGGEPLQPPGNAPDAYGNYLTSQLPRGHASG